MVEGNNEADKLFWLHGNCWSGRYYVYARIPNLTYRRKNYENVKLRLIKFRCEEEETHTLMRLEGFNPETGNYDDYVFLEKQALLTFSEEQAPQMIYWLKKHLGAEAWKTLAPKLRTLTPEERSYMDGKFFTINPERILYFHVRNDYDLPFYAYGYHDLKDGTEEFPYD